MKLNKIMAVLLAGSMLIPNVAAAASIPIIVNGKAIAASSTPAYVSLAQRTMIPVRSVGEVLGLDVQWQSPNVILAGESLTTGKKVTVSLNTKTASAVINGNALDNIIELKEGNSYITLRVLAEAFGYEVEWRDQCVYINRPDETSFVAATSNASFNQQVLKLVNAERANAGLSALTLDDSLCQAALMKSQDMSSNNYFNHTSPTYGSPFEMLTKLGISYSAAGENIAKGYTTPEAVVTGWMNSPGHRANILNAQYTYMGVGYVSSGSYWTQLFIKR